MSRPRRRRYHYIPFATISRERGYAIQDALIAAGFRIQRDGMVGAETLAAWQAYQARLASGGTFPITPPTAPSGINRDLNVAGLETLFKNANVSGVTSLTAPGAREQALVWRHQLGLPRTATPPTLAQVQAAVDRLIKRVTDTTPHIQDRAAILERLGRLRTDLNAGNPDIGALLRATDLQTALTRARGLSRVSGETAIAIPADAAAAPAPAPTLSTLTAPSLNVAEARAIFDALTAGGVNADRARALIGTDLNALNAARLAAINGALDGGRSITFSPNGDMVLTRPATAGGPVTIPRVLPDGHSLRTATSSPSGTAVTTAPTSSPSAATASAALTVATDLQQLRTRDGSTASLSELHRRLQLPVNATLQQELLRVTGQTGTGPAVLNRAIQELHRILSAPVSGSGAPALADLRDAARDITQPLVEAIGREVSAAPPAPGADGVVRTTYVPPQGAAQQLAV